jgi:hypothetical protein
VFAHSTCAGAAAGCGPGARGSDTTTNPLVLPGIAAPPVRVPNEAPLASPPRPPRPAPARPPAGAAADQESRAADGSLQRLMPLAEVCMCIGRCMLMLS